jgi:hypothetical protein
MAHDRGTFTVTAEMAAAVNLYLNDVWARMDLGHDEFHVEQQFSLHTISNQLFGRNDLVLYKTREQELWLWDYKHGAGVYVEAEGNEQLAFYMVGAILKLSGHPIKRIVLTIVQPNFDCAEGPIRRWEVTPYEAFEWLGRFQEAYQLANSDKATWVTGDHCRWCAGAAGCDALHLQSLEGFLQPSGAVVTPDPKQMTSLEMGHRLRQADIIELWIKTLRERAYSEALAGRPPHGFKLVDKRATRKWIGDLKETVDGIRKAYPGISLDEITSYKAVSPAQLEKLVGKECMTLVSGMIVKESSGKALVPASDERAEVKTGIEADFGDILQ